MTDRLATIWDIIDTYVIGTFALFVAFGEEQIRDGVVLLANVSQSVSGNAFVIAGGNVYYSGIEFGTLVNIALSVVAFIMVGFKCIDDTLPRIHRWYKLARKWYLERKK